MRASPGSTGLVTDRVLSRPPLLALAPRSSSRARTRIRRSWAGWSEPRAARGCDPELCGWLVAASAFGHCRAFGTNRGIHLLARRDATDATDVSATWHRPISRCGGTRIASILEERGRCRRMVSAGRTPTVALDAGQLAHQARVVRALGARPTTRARRSCGVAECLRASAPPNPTSPRGDWRGNPGPGPRGDLYGVDDVRLALIRDGSLSASSFSRPATSRSTPSQRSSGSAGSWRLGWRRTRVWHVGRRQASVHPLLRVGPCGRSLVHYRASAAVNRPYDAFVPPDAIALGNVGHSVLPGVLLNGKAVDALIAAAKIKVLSQATPIGKLKLILENDLPKTML